MNRLLAKSYDHKKHPVEPPGYALLVQHSRDVATACDELFRAAGSIALFNAGFDEESLPQFQTALRANGWLQDLGKASNHFQEMVEHPSDSHRQMMRHETISGLLLWSRDSPLASWFAELKLPLRLLRAAWWGAMGHHRKFHEDTKPERCNALTVRVTDEDFRTILIEMSESLTVKPPDEFKQNVVFAYSRREANAANNEIGAYEAVRELQSEFSDLKKEFDTESRRMIALIKAFGIAADVAASAVAKHEYKAGSARTDYIKRFVCEKMSVGLVPQELEELVTKRLAHSINKKVCATEASDSSEQTKPEDVRALFQRRVAETAAEGSLLSLARAGCGSGKSIAAYMWAQQWCQRLANEGRKNFRLFFCLPTTGTTTEHYKDYALESGIEDAALIHSRAEVDLLEISLSAPQESAIDSSDDTARAAQQALAEMRDRIESLELWSTPLVVSTTDTVLGLMANARRAIYSFPAIMSAAVVFDEIHAYDDQLFGHLLVFLKNFPRLPILLMTASLPEDRLRALRNARPDLSDKKIIEGPPEFEDLRRYIIHDAAADDEVQRSIEECVSDGGKVLWVCNRVERANKTYAACRAKWPDAAVNVYHSRFRYKDRSRRHRRVIDSFNCPKSAAILVATQVAEMSLDLSADLLVTDIAPVTALIQRMGRLNRRAMPDDSEEKRQPKPALIRPLPPNEEADPKPYEKDEIFAARRWLKQLKMRGDAFSQSDLAETLASLETNKAMNVDQFLKRAERNACFFSGVWETRPGETRGDGYTVSVLLDQDVKRCEDFDRNGEPSRKWIRQYEVSIIFKPEVIGWPRIAEMRCAPDDAVLYDYDEETEDGVGAEWKQRR
ncbi:MAG TPA: CRISPR-associated helicase Cas3' [Pyrinomonadaceae bacterium]|jgi:CRISPR-associated endonuclease/helicase Cas3|nr:CRISPR-associated helicase Cas3' [Pyrinomonadaceae bacterium]